MSLQFAVSKTTGISYCFVPDDVEVVPYKELVTWYEEAGTASDLGRQLGVSASVVRRHLVRAGVVFSRDGGHTAEPSQTARLERTIQRLRDENLTLRRENAALAGGEQTP